MRHAGMTKISLQSKLHLIFTNLEGYEKRDFRN